MPDERSPQSPAYFEGIPSEEEFGTPTLSGEVNAATRKAAEDRVATDKSEDRGTIIAILSALAAVSAGAGAALEIPAFAAVVGLLLSSVGLAAGRLATNLALKPFTFGTKTRDKARSAVDLDPGILVMVERLSTQRTNLESLGRKSRLHA